MIHQSHVGLLLFVVSRWETAKLCPKTDLRNLWIVSYFVLFFLSLRPMSIVSYQFCPVPTCPHHVFCTLFSCLSIDSSLYHVIFSHVVVFSVFFVKGKGRILITFILIYCEWFIIKLCGMSIILFTDLLSGITYYYFSIDLRFDCIFHKMESYHPKHPLVFYKFLKKLIFGARSQMLVNVYCKDPPVLLTIIVLIDNPVRRLLFLNIVQYFLIADSMDGLRPNLAYTDQFWMNCGCGICIK